MNPEPFNAEPFRRRRRDRVERSALVALCLVSVVGMGWDPNRNGWSNAYYSVVAWSGSQSWPSMFFGSLEPFDVVSTDKPPLSFWLPALVVRAFGLHSWTLVVSQLALTIFTIVLLHNVVRRVAGRSAGLAAAALYAVTPIVGALAMQNQPDVLLTVLCLMAVYAAVRLIEAGSEGKTLPRRWLVLCGVALGGAFLTKWVLGWFVVPALLWALWAVLGRGSWARAQVVGLVGAVTALSGLWWVAVLALLGPDRRPFPDSPTGRILDLVLGQNGLRRLSGSGGGAISGQPGPLRLVLMPFADQVGWFVPLALGLLGWLCWIDRKGALHPRTRAGMRLFGGWALILVVLFSAMGGAMHPYYTVQLAVPVAALAGIGISLLWVHGRQVVLAWSLAVAAGYGAWVGWASGSPSWVPPLGLLLAVVGVVMVTFGRLRSGRHTGWVVLAAALAIGPLATHWGTLSHPVVGADSMAGWRVTDRSDPYPRALIDFLGAQQGVRWIAAAPQATPAAALSLQAGRAVLPLGGFTGSGGAPTVAQLEGSVARGELRYVAMIGRYTSRPEATPVALRHSALATVMDWVRATGCPQVVGGITVIDLTDRSCR